MLRYSSSLSRACSDSLSKIVDGQNWQESTQKLGILACSDYSADRAAIIVPVHSDQPVDISTSYRSGFSFRKERENLRFEFWPIFAPKKHSAKGEGSCGVPTHRTQATRHCAAHLSSATHIAISARDTRCDEAHTGVVISALLSRWYESGIFTAPARVLGTAFVDERPKHVSVKSIALRQSGRVKSRVNSDSRGLIFLYNRRAVCSRPKGVAARSFLVGS